MPENKFSNNSFLKKISLGSGLKEKRTIIMVIVIILLLSGTVLRQSLLDALQTSQNLKKNKERLKILTQKADYLANLDGIALDKAVYELDQVFPSKKPSLELLYSLRSLALEDMVSLSSLSLKPGLIGVKSGKNKDQGGSEEYKDEVQDFTVDFSVSGESSKVFNFIKDLQKTAPLMKIESLQLSILDSNPTAMMVGIKLNVRVYYQEQPPTIPAVDVPVQELSSQEKKLLSELKDFIYFPLKPVSAIVSGKEDIFVK
jgi:hypothetical protein